MNSPLSYPLIKTALAVSSGILIEEYGQVHLPWLLIIVASIVLFSSLFILRKWHKGLYGVESVVVWILFISCGGQASISLASEVYLPNQGEIEGTFFCENVQVKTKLVVADGVLADSISSFKTKVICFTSRADTVHLQSGCTHRIKGKLNHFQLPNNPFEFDQKHYNEGKGFSAQVILTETHLLNRASLSSMKQNSHVWIQNQFNHIENLEVRALLVAFTTGDKQFLSSSTKDAFSKSGVMHLLAVSGLHVSLVASLPLLLLKRSRKKSSKACWFFTALIVVWLYAWLTGFQASVLRAATMLSLIGLAQVLNVSTSSINQLGAAATFILLAEPSALFTVGFQLSFAAVGAILMWAPLLAKCVRTKNRSVNKLINGACVSTAAQAGSSPLSIFYFHSFPLLFLPTNLIAIPLATALLYGALAILLLGSLGVELEWIFFVVEWLGNGLILLATWVSNIWFSCAEGLYLSVFEVLALYFFLITVFSLMATKRKKRSYRMFALSFGLLLFCQSQRCIPFNELTVFTGSKDLVVGIRNENEAVLIANGLHRKGAVSGWAKRYGAKTIVLESDTLIESPFLIWKRGKEWGCENVVFSELLEQKKSVLWDGIVVQKTRSKKGWKMLIPNSTGGTDTIHQYGRAETYLFNSNGLPVLGYNLHTLPKLVGHSKE